MDYSEHAIQWEAEKQHAIATMSCFCVCGCRLDGAPTTDLLGIVRPGLCPECKMAAKTKKGRKAHFVMTRGHQNFVDPEDEAPRPQGRRIRAFTDRLRNPRRAEAESYVREYGPDGLRVVSDLYEKVMAGEHLTEVQVDAVLRSKAAEKRSAWVAHRELNKAERRVAKKRDLTRILIPETVEDGTYALLDDKDGVVVMTVFRPTVEKNKFKGDTVNLPGFTVIEMVVDGVVQKWGVQHPQPARVDNPDHRQFYRGWYAHLVADLVDNPEAARERYQQMEAGA